jgi:hypothetical protein
VLLEKCNCTSRGRVGVLLAKTIRLISARRASRLAVVPLHFLLPLAPCVFRSCLYSSWQLAIILYKFTILSIAIATTTLIFILTPSLVSY